MASQIRLLFGTIGTLRPDLPKAQINLSLQEAVKDVCRRTFLLRQTLQYSITANTNSVLAASTLGSFLKIHDVIWKSGTDTDWSVPLIEDSFVVAAEDGLWKKTGLAPKNFSQQNGTLILYPTPVVGGVIQVVISYAPSVGTDIVNIPLPEAAITAIQLKAEAYASRMPGQYMNLQFSLDREKEFKRCLNNLKATSLFGDGGEVMARNLYPY